MSKKGFTLIELLVVIGIVAVLVSLGTISYNTAQKSARDTKRKSDLRDVKLALQLYYNSYNQYPPVSLGGNWNEVWNRMMYEGSTGSNGMITLGLMKNNPCDPKTGTSGASCSFTTDGFYYAYTNFGDTNPQRYRLYAKMENSGDSVLSSDVDGLFHGSGSVLSCDDPAYCFDSP